MTILERELRSFGITLEPWQLKLYREWAKANPRGGGYESKPHQLRPELTRAMRAAR